MPEAGSNNQAFPKMKNRRFEFSVTPLNPAQVDAGNGVIYGVAIITSNVAAKGHDLHVDETTLRQLKECAEEKGRVPVKWNHRTGADAVNGYLDNFRIAGGKLLGDWHLLKTHDRFQQALEMAERMPGNVGLSAAFMGEDEKRGGKTYARCSELISVDLVAQPAANPDGLFEVRDPRARNRFGQFAGAAASADDPSAVAAAYDPAIIEERKRLAKAAAWRNVLAQINGTKRQENPPQDLPQTESSTEFSDARTQRGRGFLRGAAIAAGAVVGAKLGLKAAQVIKYRKAVAGEQLAGRVVGVGKRSGQGVIHVGVADAKGKISHLAPGAPRVQSETIGDFRGPHDLFVERGARRVDPAQIRKNSSGIEKWNLVGANCEHAASRLTGRKPSSPQIRGTLAGAGIGAGAMAAATRRTNRKNGTREMSALEVSAKEFAARGVQRALGRFPIHFEESGKTICKRCQRVFRKHLFACPGCNTPVGIEKTGGPAIAKHFAERRRELPAFVKAGLSAAASGAALGLVPAFRRGTGLKTVLKSVGVGAGVGAAIGGGGTAIGEAVLGKPRDDEGAPITKRAAIGGGIAGAVGGMAAGVLALKSSAGRRMLVSASKTWRPAKWARSGGVPLAVGIGALGGGIAGAAHGADEGQQVDTLNSMKKDRMKTSNKSFAAKESLAAARYRKQIQNEDLNRRDANILRAGAVGAAAGALSKTKGMSLASRAVAGAIAGTGAVLGIRRVSESRKDRYGDRPRGAKQAENILPVAAGLGIAGLALRKRFFEANPELVELSERFKVRPRSGTVPMNVSGLARHLLMSRDTVYGLLKSGHLTPVGEHPRLKTFAVFDSRELDEIRNARVDEILFEAARSLDRLGGASPRLVELSAKESISQATRAADRGSREIEFGVGALVIKGLLNARKVWKPVLAGLGGVGEAGGFGKLASAFGKAASKTPLLTGAAMGAAGGAVAGGIKAATDDDPNTGILNGALSGAVKGSVVGGVAGRTFIPSFGGGGAGAGKFAPPFAPAQVIERKKVFAG